MYIYRLSELPADKGLHFGGKADSLDKMLKAGLPVPEGYAVAAEAFRDGALIPDAANELAELVKNLPAVYTYAVRSSAVGEDGKEASFAGAYETVTNVKVTDIPEALKKVAESAGGERVSVYAKENSRQTGSIAAVIQRFISPDYAGVLFTADPISADSAVMTGNFVRGEGETLVSGEGSDGEFSINALKYSYSGSEEMRPAGKKLYGLAKKIVSLYGCPQDIEWAVKDGKVYILQARPITTIFVNDYERFNINDSLCGKYLLSKTNVGEIFLRPVSPVTYGILRNVCDMLGFAMISNVCGQLYLNISGVCSMLCSFGMSREKAFSTISEIAGGIPKDMYIPIFPYDKKVVLKKLMQAVRPGGEKGKKKPDFGKDFVNHIPENSDKLIREIKAVKSCDELSALWADRCGPFMKKTFSSIVTGLSVKPLFSSREKLGKVCSPELTDRLLSDSSGGKGIESLGTLLAIDDVINGKMSREEYSLRYGHRHADEMELILPYPYESPDFPENVIRDYKETGINAYELKAAQEKSCREAVEEFKRLYPKKSRWLDGLLKKYGDAVAGRERIRSDALRMFCMIREYLLKAGELTGLGEDVFMLYIEEVEKCLKGENIPAETVNARREKYNEQMKYPKFPSIICGRFTVEEWQQSGGCSGYYCAGETSPDESGDTITGVAGSCGQAEGIARVMTTIDEAEDFKKGEILVVPAANIGWIKLFPKAAAIVTDIGAPLSHAVIVARELGIPAAVSCQYASGAIKTGDRIRVDGTAGKVTVLERVSEDKQKMH